LKIFYVSNMMEKRCFENPNNISSSWSHQDRNLTAVTLTRYNQSIDGNHINNNNGGLAANRNKQLTRRKVEKHRSNMYNPIPAKIGIVRNRTEYGYRTHSILPECKK